MTNQKNKETAVKPAEAVKTARQPRKNSAKTQAKGKTTKSESKTPAKKTKAAPKAKSEKNELADTMQNMQKAVHNLFSSENKSKKNRNIGMYRCFFCFLADFCNSTCKIRAW